ncbi:hypothetical protein A2U01_0114058, partial [Trifolium medium]|nr:hypothetical protein [Trifolium medium]
MTERLASGGQELVRLLRSGLLAPQSDSSAA